MPKHILRILICGYACILCAAAALIFALPTLGISANRYSFACIACAGAFGLLAVLGGHLGRDFRLWQGLALLLGGVIWILFSIRPEFIWFSAFFGLMMALTGGALAFLRNSRFAGYLGLAYSTICALMLFMSGIALYLARDAVFSELTYLLQSFLAFCAFLLSGLCVFFLSREKGKDNG